MAVKDQAKILDNKIRQNKADYDLYRQNAEISALISGDLNKYEYLTNKDLDYKPDPIQKAKFEYDPLGQVFNKGLTTDERQEGLLKRLKNIEDKTDDLRAIKDKDNQLSVKTIDNIIKEELSQGAKNTLKKLSDQEKIINYRELYLKGGNNSQYDLTDYRS